MRFLFHDILTIDVKLLTSIRDTKTHEGDEHGHNFYD